MTFMPAHLAVRKWPSSWSMIITMHGDDHHEHGRGRAGDDGGERDGGRRPRAGGRARERCSSGVGGVLERPGDRPRRSAARVGASISLRHAAPVLFAPRPRGPLSGPPVGLDHDVRTSSGVAPSCPSRTSASTSAIASHGMTPVEEGGDRHLVGGVQPRRGRAAHPAGLVGEAQARERVEVGRLEVEPPQLRPVDGAEGRRCRDRDRPGRSRSAAACRAGESWATVAPSVNSTIEWTIDCGCTTTSMRS